MAEVVHKQTRDDNYDAPLRRASGRPALSPAEHQAVTALVGASGDTIAQFVQDRAAAFASGDPAVRRRAAARSAAIHEQLMTQLAALLAAAVARRDERAVKMLDRCLTAATTRYRLMLEALRLECAPTRRVVAVANGPVTVAVEERG